MIVFFCRNPKPSNRIQWFLGVSDFGISGFSHRLTLELVHQVWLKPQVRYISTPGWYARQVDLYVFVGPMAMCSYVAFYSKDLPETATPVASGSDVLSSHQLPPKHCPMKVAESFHPEVKQSETACQLQDFEDQVWKSNMLGWNMLYFSTAGYFDKCNFSHVPTKWLLGCNLKSYPHHYW